MASLEYQYSDYTNRISRYLGTGINPMGQALTDAQDLFHRAYRRFLYPVIQVGTAMRLHTWDFMRKTAMFNVTPGSTNYAMPLDYGDIETPFTYVEQDRTMVTTLQNIDEASMLRMLSFHDSQGEPQYYCIRPIPYSQTAASSHEVIFYPIPNANYTFAYTYNVNPPKLSAPTDTPMGGVECCECLMQMCLAAAELQEDETAGVQEQKATQLLMMAIQADKERNASDTVGYNSDSSYDKVKLPPGFVTSDPRWNGYNIFGTLIR